VTHLLRPFTGYVPASESGPLVVGPPSLLLTKEQKEATKREPLSFRHAAGRRAHTPHEDATGWLDRLEKRRALVPVGPAVIVYRQRSHDHTAVGVLANVTLDAYQTGRIKPHERTIAKTRAKMAKYMQTTRVYGNPAVLTHRSNAELTSVLAGHIEGSPDVSFTSIDGIRHEMWLVDGDGAEQLCRLYEGPFYITDGHHRFSAAAEVAKEEGRHSASLPVGVFAADQLSLRSFARCITDPKLDHKEVRSLLEAAFEMRQVSGDHARPERRAEVGVGIGKRRYILLFDETTMPDDDYEALDLKLLQSQILRPLFDVADARKDDRVRFVPDLPSGAAPEFDADVWFLPFPPVVEDVISVADNGMVMPAKSTLFFPKLPSGLIIRHLDVD